MPLETGNVIEDLDQSWPLGGDPTNKGDDHLRLIKSVLITQFPGVSGNGYAIPITATEAELNFLDGTTTNIAQDISDLRNAVSSLGVNLSAPVGTKMTFFNTVVPLGWVQDTTNNDAMMRVVATVGGGVGGVVSPTTLNWTHTHTTGSLALTIAQMPVHNHISGMPWSSSGYGVAAMPNTNLPAGSASFTTNSPLTNSVGSGAAHNHGSTGSAGNTWSPKYINIIIGTKS